MNDYLIFYQDGENDSTRDFVEVRAMDLEEAENEVLYNFPQKNIISIFERVWK
jgi:hypothetical protein